jgi:hypothetical protein
MFSLLSTSYQRSFSMSDGYVPDRKIFMTQPFRTATTQHILDNRASELGRQIYEEIEDYDAELDDTHEVGIRLVNFGQTVVFHLKALEWMNPSLICFRGTTEEGHPVKLIQHTSQISILLMTLPRRDPENPKAPIGFGRFREETEEVEEEEIE